MRTVKWRSFSVLLSMLLLSSAAFPYETDDTVPEVTDRVARISFVSGEVQIRRDGSDDWEKADLNLPVVEGDEITTSEDARVEIQFNSKTHLRIAEDSYVQVKRLGDEGVALSVSRGSVSVRTRKFDLDKEYFEIDAPSTTVAVQREGVYRIDAGTSDEREIRVGVTEGGEARVYSTNSGFTLRSGRSARVLIEGDLAGEWETADAGRFADKFDSWAIERDETIAKRLARADYDKYYDQDIYGAEDLNDNGDWEYTRDYGYVWRPYEASIRGYRDWSPYRYGSWRWVPPFGWTWVNDEPWGWATYHHGRWIFYRNRWVWTPYGYYRSNRSWWYPALVVIRVINRSICWYPLGYGQTYSNYNHGYHDWSGNRRRRRHGDGRPPVTGGGGNPVVPPATRPPREREPIEWENETARKGRFEKNPVDSEVPPSGVVSIKAESFGVTRKIGTTAPPEMAKTVLSKIDRESQSPPELPNFQAVRTKVPREFATAPPAFVSKSAPQVRTGAAERTSGAPLDQELRKTRIFGNRQPAPVSQEAPIQTGGQPIPRRTGAVGRPPAPKREVEPTPIEPGPRREPPAETPIVKESPRTERPPRREPPVPKEESPRFEPPREVAPKPRQETPRIEPPRRDPSPPKQESPRYEPKPRSEEPPPRRDPPAPRQESPKNDPPPRRESPPPKSEPPPSKAPAPPAKSDSGGARKKDG